MFHQGSPDNPKDPGPPIADCCPRPSIGLEISAETLLPKREAANAGTAGDTAMDFGPSWISGTSTDVRAVLALPLGLRRGCGFGGDGRADDA